MKVGGADRYISNINPMPSLGLSQTVLLAIYPLGQGWDIEKDYEYSWNIVNEMVYLINIIFYLPWSRKIASLQRHISTYNGIWHQLLRVFHTMDILWERFQWIPSLLMKPINFQSKASVVCSVTTAVFIDFSLKKLCFPNILVKTQANIFIPWNKCPGIKISIKFMC